MSPSSPTSSCCVPLLDQLPDLALWEAELTTDPVVRDPAPDAESGRGLHLVDLLATDWGYYRPTPRRQNRLVHPGLPTTSRGAG